jgi:hypothetical protein
MNSAEPTRDPELMAPESEFASRVIQIFGWVLSLAASLYLINKSRAAGEDSWYPVNRALDLLKDSPGTSIYEALFFSGHVKFQYPPTGLLYVDLLRHLGLTNSAPYNTINAGLVILTGLAFATFATRVLPFPVVRGIRFPVAPVSYLAAVLCYPTQLALQLGQMQTPLGLLVILACLARLDARNVLAGCFIAAAATVKPQFALLGLLAVRQGNWTFVVSFSAVLAAAFALSFALYGWTNDLDYLKVLSFLSQHGEYHHLNQSINGMLNRWLYDGPSLDRDPDNPIPNSALPPYIPAVYFGTMISTLCLIAVAFAMRAPKTAGADIVGFCLSIMLFTMASPIAWVHHYNVVLPAVAVALSACLKEPDGSHKNALLALVLLSFVLIAFPLMRPFGPTIPALNIPQSHVFIGACILAGLLLRLLYIGRWPGVGFRTQA